jgi:uncharacterized protein DUF1259
MTSSKFTIVFLLLLAGFVSRGENRTGAAPIEWSQVGKALGKSGSVQPDGVYRVGLPRSDLNVSLGGVRLKPALALGSWIGFQQTGPNAAVAMGDLVLLQTEVGSVVAKLQLQGIEQTAIHNHLLHESPHVMYVHIRGEGEPVKLAEAIHSALLLSKTPLGESPAKSQSLDLDTAVVNQVLGRSGKANGGVYQVSVPRADNVTEKGMEVAPSLGVATALNFQPAGGKRAAITGDFVLIGSEVNPVIKALSQNGIGVTALHSHMLDESPRLFFMHSWADDDAAKLARGLRAALDNINVKRSS